MTIMKRLRFISVAIFLFASFLPCWRNHAAVISSDTFIGVSDFSYDGLDLVVTNCTLTIDGQHIFSNLQILDGGFVTHSPLSNGPVQVTFQVTNELHTISDTNPAVLHFTNIFLSSITVQDASNTVT